MKLRWLFGSALLVLFGLAGCTARSAQTPAAAPAQTAFTTPQAAADALDHAAQQNDVAVLQQIFGKDGGDLVSTGDTTADAQDRQQFVQAYQQMHRFTTASNGEVTLYIGAENWPFPVPLIEQNGQWRFDATGGEQEVLVRRIGRNEGNVIDICNELVSAESDYRAKMHHYAQHFVSDPGQRNGLFWSSGDAAEPSSDSPIGPLLAFASREGVAKAKRTPTPFHGYYYRMLPAPASGYAFIAYPAAYRSSGVMSFLVTQTGVVYQKDLGPSTDAAARALTTAPADSSWTKAE